MHRLRVSSFLILGSKTLDLVEQFFGPPSLRSYLAEFLSTFIFVFAGVGSAVSAGKFMISGTTSAQTCQVAVALAHAFALFMATYVAGNATGHVNPAVTFGLVVGRHISILSGICYWVAQLLGSTMACVLLMLVTAGQAIPTHGLAMGVTGFGGTVMESTATFAVVSTVFVARMDSQRGSHGIIGPIAIGFMDGANILALGPLTGGSMNPALSFGPAIITGGFKNHWVYWVGPLIGGGLAGLVYGNIMSRTNNQSSLTDVA